MGTVNLSGPKCTNMTRQYTIKDNLLKMGIMDLKLWQNVSGHVKRQLQVNFRPSLARGCGGAGRGTKIAL